MRALVASLALAACASGPQRTVAVAARAVASAAPPAAPTLTALGARFANGTGLALVGRRATWTDREGHARAVDLAPAGSCEFAPWGASVVARCGRLLRLTDAGRALVVPGPGRDATAFARPLGELSLSDDGEHAAGLWPCAGDVDGPSLCARDAVGTWRDLPLPAPDEESDAPVWRVVAVRGATAHLERTQGPATERFTMDLDTGAVARDDHRTAVEAARSPVVTRALEGAFPCATSGDATTSRWGDARLSRAGAIRVADDGAGARWWSVRGEGAGPLDDATRSLALLAAGAGAVVAQGAFSDARILWLDGDRTHPLDDLSAAVLFPEQRTHLRLPSSWTARADADGLTAWVELSQVEGEVLRFGADGRILWQRSVTTRGARHGLARIAGRWGWALWEPPGPVSTFTVDGAGQLQQHAIAWDGRVRACEHPAAPDGDEVTWAGCFQEGRCLLAVGGDEQQTCALQAGGLCLAEVTAYTTVTPVGPRATAPGSESHPRLQHVEAAGGGALVGFVDDGRTRSALTCHVNE